MLNAQQVTVNDILIATNHPQIKWAQSSVNQKMPSIKLEIDHFLSDLSTLQEMEIVKEMKKLVPEFKSNHSVHSALD